MTFAVKLAVLSFLMASVAHSLRLKKEKGPKKANPKKINGINYSLKQADQESNEKKSKAELQEIEKKHTTGAMRDIGPIDDYLEMWYVNGKDAKDRRQCMDKQMEEMQIKSNRFEAFSFKRCRSAAEDDLVSCLIQKKYGDCVKSGVNLGAVSTHGTAGNTDLERKYHIVSNWCSHKRMMSQMLKQHKEKNSTAKYAVILEDDVSFTRSEFLRKVVNFAETYDGKMSKTWTMVQIDPFGSKCDRHIYGKFEGLPVWKPTNVNKDHECSNYWGAQALLVKFSALPSIIKHMEDHPTVPLDWLPAQLPGGLAWQASIALNPESRNVQQEFRQWVNFPKYCKGSVKDSTIGSFRQKRT